MKCGKFVRSCLSMLCCGKKTSVSGAPVCTHEMYCMCAESLKTGICGNPQREHTRRLTFFLPAWGEQKCGPADLKVQDPILRS